MRIAFLILVFFFVAIENNSFAAFPLKTAQPKPMSVTGANSIDPVTALYGGREPVLSPFINYHDMSQLGNYRRKKCLVSKIGTGMVIGGGGLILIGLYYGAATQNVDVALGFYFSGIGAVVAGGVLALAGGIYNHSHKGRLTFIAPKPNEAGLAFRF